MNFQNSFIDFKITGDNSLKITAPDHTDLFISPDGRYEINKSPRLSIVYSIADGGAAPTSDPHFLFGSDPMFSSMVAPFNKSEWVNQGLFNGWPFSFADWIYLLAFA